MAATIIDIAKKAGVSPSTVSRVISGHPRISSATASKVKEIMEEMGYHPNAMAKSLVSRTTNTIGIVLPSPAEELFRNMFFPEVIRGIVTQSTRSSYDLMITTGMTEREELEAVTCLVKGRRVDGVLLLHSRKQDPVVGFLKDERFPFVLVGRSEDHPDIDSVDNDNVQASYEATRHLISQGHERIGFASGPPNLIVSMDRLQGYRQALAESDLKTRSEWIIEGEYLQESGYRAMSFFMNLPERPTAIIVSDDVVALGVLRGLAELGYKAPDDLCVVGFNNIPMAELASPPLSSVDIGIYQIGYTASQTLIRLIKGESAMQFRTRTIIPHRLIVRESSSPRHMG